MLNISSSFTSFDPSEWKPCSWWWCDSADPPKTLIQTYVTLSSIHFCRSAWKLLNMLTQAQDSLINVLFFSLIPEVSVIYPENKSLLKQKRDLGFINCQKTQRSSPPLYLRRVSRWQPLLFDVQLEKAFVWLDRNPPHCGSKGAAGYF